ncbi:MAG: prepilin-type N-terminal cleavage/methylation domain-containing protein [Candidatus Zixiibacteriota bacterium]|nr:MAG: prepilin-type N-terminal cleavage/methylation domain-containing protein [candidate division Zixibacteria bacterium]
MFNDKGLSLLEVLVAMIILSLGILGMAPMVVMSIEGNNMSRDVLVVSSLAAEKLEHFESLETLPEFPYKEEETGLEGGYNRATIIQDNTTDATIPDGVCRIDVVISWTDKTGVARSTTYSTLLMKG